jgi:hypothetical protein
MGVVYTSNVLHQCRIRGGLTIDELVRRTKIPRIYIEMIDEGRLPELPAGIYGRSYVRAFAVAVGMNPDDALADAAAGLVEVPDPLPALRQITREQTPPTLAAAIAERIREWNASRDGSEPLKLPGAIYFAAGMDALFLFVLNAFIVAVAANACHVSVGVLLRVAGAAMSIVCGFTAAMYFVLLAGIGGQTLGMRLFRTELRSVRGPLDIRAIGLRSVEAVLGGSSVLVDWLCSSEMPKRRESPV